MDTRACRIKQGVLSAIVKGLRVVFACRVESIVSTFLLLFNWYGKCYATRRCAIYLFRINTTKQLI